MLPFRSWRAGNRGVLAGLSLLLFCGLFAGETAFAQKGKKPAKTTKAKKGKASASSSPTESGSPAEQSLTNIPLPIGHEAKGLILPDFDLQGHLRGKFIAATARRLNEENVLFTDLKITTFTEENETDLQVDLHTATFNLKTKILSSKESGTVKRADFNIVGDTLEFDTDKRVGHMVGHVKMVITSNSKLMQKEGNQ